MALRRRVGPTRKPRRWRLKKQEWVDPYAWIPGTKPEKMVFAALAARRIYFIFQGDIPVDEKKDGPLLAARDFKPDFILPEWKVILDPFGDFHHSQPEAVKRDAIKAVYFEALGYEFVHPWSSEIEKNGGDWVLSQSVRLRGPAMFGLSRTDAEFKAKQGYRLGPNVGLGANSVAIANRKRTRPKSLTLRRRTRR